MESAITNPNGALSTVTDYRTGKTSDGQELQQGQIAWPFEASVAINKGDMLMFVAPSATAPVTVAPMTAAISASDPHTFAGVALEAASIGDLVPVLQFGIGIINHVVADTPAALDVFGLPQTTTGLAETNAAVTGLFVVGLVLGPEIGTTNQFLGRLALRLPLLVAT